MGYEPQLDQLHLMEKGILTHISGKVSLGKKRLWNKTRSTLPKGKRGFEPQLSQPRLRAKGDLNNNSVNLALGQKML